MSKINIFLIIICDIRQCYIFLCVINMIYYKFCYSVSCIKSMWNLAWHEKYMRVSSSLWENSTIKKIRHIDLNWTSLCIESCWNSCKTASREKCARGDSVFHTSYESSPCSTQKEVSHGLQLSMRNEIYSKPMVLVILVVKPFLTHCLYAYTFHAKRDFTWVCNSPRKSFNFCQTLHILSICI